MSSFIFRVSLPAVCLLQSTTGTVFLENCGIKINYWSKSLNPFINFIKARKCKYYKYFLLNKLIFIFLTFNLKLSAFFKVIDDNYKVVYLSAGVYYHLISITVPFFIIVLFCSSVTLSIQAYTPVSCNCSFSFPFQPSPGSEVE